MRGGRVTRDRNYDEGCKLNVPRKELRAHVGGGGWGVKSVSYTHLDVYKRQVKFFFGYSPISHSIYVLLPSFFIFSYFLIYCIYI